MLFHVTWEQIDTSEEGLERSLKVLSQWKPAEGADFKAFYEFTDGSGGAAIIEIDSAATMARLTGPWLPWLSFTIKAILPNDEAAAIAGEAIAFRASVR